MGDGRHVQRRVTRYEAGSAGNRGPGYVAWCSCGIGSPLKTTRAKAEASLAAHTAKPQEFPK